MQVVIGSFSQILDADFARVSLESNGIVSYLRNRPVVSRTRNDVTEIQVVVRKEDAPLAKSVINPVQ